MVLVNNKKVFTENLSLISQFRSQNHDDLKKKSFRLNSRAFFPSESYAQKPQNSASLNSFFSEIFRSTPGNLLRHTSV